MFCSSLVIDGGVAYIATSLEYWKIIMLHIHPECLLAVDLLLLIKFLFFSSMNDYVVIAVIYVLFCIGKN